MQIINNKAVLLRTRKPDKYTVIPKSKDLGEVAPGLHEVLVFWGLDEMRVLRNLGVKAVPSPIKAKYDWPGKHKPFAHQIETASFLTLHRRAFVFNDPGTGKTLSALWAADYLMQKGYIRRCLILCPLSIMQDAWMNGISKSVIHRTAIVAHHQQAVRRIEMVQGDYEFVIINYDGLNLIANEIRADGRFDLIIVDEANAYKNVSTRRWKALNSLISPKTYLWMMTGTPASQSPLDAYGLAKLVNPTGVPNFFTAWRDKTMNKTPQQKKYYMMLKELMLVQAAGETITAVNAAAGVSKLLQISAGAAYTDGREVVEFDCSPRLSVLLEVLEETTRKVLVFAPFRHSIDTIHNFLDKHGIANEMIHGDVSVKKRTDIFRRFQSEDAPRVLVIQPQAAAHGVTLTAADTVIFWGPVMSVETYKQCIARSDRIGQDSTKVTVIHLQGSDMERKMFKMLEERVEDHAMLIKLYEEEVAQ
jgi:SNF2 family DNA or RNA helicase